jgi:GNAT superfamily N-acetyltransferase
MNIRVATSTDAPAIARLMLAVWSDEAADSTHIAHVLEQGNRTTLVAEEDGNLLGFVDAFGTTFWELDLMAVDPAAQGKGIGKQLTYRALEEGSSKGFRVARGLVALANIASQSVMRHMGLIPAGISTLYVFSEQVADVTTPLLHPNVTEVQTFRYSGGWLTDPYIPEVFRAAAALCPTKKWDVVGAVIPDDDTVALAAAQSAGYEKVGDYRWWTKAL